MSLGSRMGAPTAAVQRDEVLQLAHNDHKPRGKPNRDSLNDRTHTLYALGTKVWED